MSNPELTLEGYIESANEAAGTAQNVTTALLATAVTLAATVLASSDEAILRNSLEAPFGVGNAINLSIAYALMPPVFLFLHISCLMQLYILAKRLNLFEQRLKSNIDNQGLAGKVLRDKWRHQLSGFSFVQYFTDDEVDEKHLDYFISVVRNLLLWLIVHFTFSWVPVGLLFATLLAFLRYQSDAISTIHLVVLLIDIGCVIWFQTAYTRLQMQPIDAPIGWVCISLGVLLLFWLLNLPLYIAVTYMFGWLIGTALFLLTSTGAISPDNHTIFARGIRLFADFFRVSTKARVLGIAAISFIAILSASAYENPTIVAVIVFWAALLFSYVRHFWRAPALGNDRQNRRRDFTSTYARFTNRQRLGWAFKQLGLIGPAIAIIAVTQAHIPNGDEAACQVRWNWDDAIQQHRIQVLDAKETSGTLKIDASVVKNKPTSPDIDYYDRIWLVFGATLGPVLGFGEVGCLEKDPHLHLSVATTVRANLFDRLFCAYGHFGCRYISLPSSTLVSETADSSALVALADDVRTTRFDVGVLRSIGLNLRSRNLRFIQLAKSRLYGVDLRKADLRGAEMSDTYLDGSLASYSRFDRARLSSGHLPLIDLTSASLEEVSMNNANLIGASLDSANFQNASLNNVQFQGGWLERAKFHGSRLTKSTFNAANLDEASFLGAAIEKTTFWGATVNGTRFEGSILLDVDLYGISPARAYCLGALLLNRTAPLANTHSATKYFESFSNQLGSAGIPVRIVERIKKRIVIDGKKIIGLPCREYYREQETVDQLQIVALPTAAIWRNQLMRLCEDPAVMRSFLKALSSNILQVSDSGNHKLISPYATALSGVLKDKKSCPIETIAIQESLGELERSLRTVSTTLPPSSPW
nr:pentapeptide repeat-containing protein [uncultured Dongia sp.]